MAATFPGGLAHFDSLWPRFACRGHVAFGLEENRLRSEDTDILGEVGVLLFETDGGYQKEGGQHRR